MKAKLIIMIISTFFLSCKNQEKELRKTIEGIEKLEYQNVYKFRQEITKLDKFKGVKKAEIYKKYFSLKSDIYFCDCPKYIPEINEFYNSLTEEQYEDLKVELDFLLLEQFYFRVNFEGLTSILERAHGYLSKPKYSREKIIFFSLISTLKDEIPLVSFHDELFNLFEEVKDEPYTYKTARVYESIIRAHRNRNERDKMFKVIEIAKKKNKEAKLNKFLIDNLTFYAVNVDKGDFENAQELSISHGHLALKLIKETGNYFYFAPLYVNMGHRYFNVKDFKNAYKNYAKALVHPMQDPYFVPLGRNYAYLGWAAFRNDKHEEAFDLFEKGFNIASNDPVIGPDICGQIVAYERKLWANNVLNPKGDHSDITSTISFLQEKKENESGKNKKLRKIAMMKLSEVNKDIEVVTGELKINKEKVKNKNYSYFFLISSSIIMLITFGFYVQKTKAVKILKERNSIHKNQNDKLNDLLQKVENNNKTLENIASETATKFNAPLKEISMQTSEISNSYKESLSESEREYFDYILTGCQNLNQIIKDLLGFSQITQKLPEKEVVDLNCLIQEIILNNEIGLKQKKLSIEIENELPTVFAHRSLFMQVFSNLINNSIKYSNRLSAKVYVGVKEGRNNNFVFYVQDFGRGIKKSEQSRVFILFNKLDKRSSTSQSSGIGLAICKKIIEYYKGRIWVDSEIESGTTMYFSIPQSELSNHELTYKHNFL